MRSLAMPASRSLIALIVGAVVLFALVFVELKPGSSSSPGGGSSSQGLGAYQGDIGKAKQAVGISNASNAASGNENAAGSSAGGATSGSSHPATTPAKPATSTAGQPAAKSASRAAGHSSTTPATAATSLSTVEAAISAHKVVAMLFYNPGAADDRAVKRELGSVPTHHGQVVKFSIPLSQAANFTAVTQQVPVNFSPTLVLIDPHGQASEILGYSDSFEIDQRVADALAAG
jgi:hypothetical protein